MSLVKDNVDHIIMNAMFREYIGIVARKPLMHEEVSAWSAPSECHDDVDFSYEQALEDLEDIFSTGIDALTEYFGIHVIKRAIAKYYKMNSWFN